MPTPTAGRPAGPQECHSLLRRMAPDASAERMLRGVLRYLADAIMLQLMSGRGLGWGVGRAVGEALRLLGCLSAGIACGAIRSVLTCLFLAAPLLPADGVPDFNLFGLQRLLNDLGGIRCAVRCGAVRCVLLQGKCGIESHPVSR